MIIGITGGTGCGKTTVLNIIRQAGGTVCDCDAIYHQLLATDTALLDAIEARFPGTVEDGKLQRKKLGAVVFHDKAALADLSKLTHGAVKAEVIRQLTPTPRLAAIDAIGLFESGLNEMCDVTLAVTAPEDARVARLMARDSIDREYALSRIRAQRPQEEFSALCDHTLVNDGAQEDFQAKCLTFFKKLAIIETN